MPLTTDGEGYRDFSEPRFFEATSITEVTKIRNPVNKAHAVIAPTDGGAVDIYKFDSADDTAADGFSILAPLNTGVTGRWRRLNEGMANVVLFGADPTGTADSTAAIQAAIDTGLSVLFPEGSYLANNLTQTTALQNLYGMGTARIIKNASGPIITSSGANVQFVNLQFRGEAGTPVFTGSNVVSSGDHFAMINSGSRWAYARAVLATGNHVQIIGTNDIYQTADATASGYDIELGVSGTATLYHQLVAIYTSQADGGILLTDVGSVIIQGGQFGKLNIKAGTSPAGVNGGVTMGCRILGDVNVELANAVFVANQFANTSTITFALGTSDCRMDDSNVIGGTVVNNGNTNNLIVRQVSAGTYITTKWGPDASNARFRLVASAAPEYLFMTGSVEAQNTYAFRVQSTAGTAGVGFSLGMSNANNGTLSNTVSGTDIILSQTGTGRVRQFVNNVECATVSGPAAGETALWLLDGDSSTLKRVSVGAADSGGAGFKLLRVAN